MGSYISGSRVVGLQFGGNMTLSDGVYWLALMSIRSTTGSSTQGLSHVGIIGQIINAINSVGSSSGLLPLGVQGPEEINYGADFSFWNGRFLAGFITATSIANFVGTAIPQAITISEIVGPQANSTATILPAVTFVST